MSQIQIEVVSVGAPQTIPTSNGRSYQAIEIAYKKDGKIEGKKIMSFSNPAVFKAVQNLTQGTIAYVTTEKNDKGYWQWEAVNTDAASAASAPVQTQSSGSTAGNTKSFSNYETKEERQQRQVMIVRQSSLSNAVATLAVGSKAVKPEDVIAVAKQYETYVMGTGPASAQPATVSFDDLEDVPL